MRIPETNSSRVRLDHFVRQAAHSVAPGSRVLDAGAGNSPYRRHFDGLRYESADFGQVEKDYADDLSYVCDLSAIPVEDGRFDLVVMTQVLEHLPEPGAVLAEMHRVLRPGARMWASMPLFYEEHEQPYDFFRYTQFALRRLFGQAGFGEVRLNWLEGYYGTLSYQTRMASHHAGPLRRPLALTAEVLARVDLRSRRTDIGHPKNYTVVATA